MTKIIEYGVGPDAEKSIEELVLKNQRPVLVVFYRPGEAGYICFQPVLEKLAAEWNKPENAEEKFLIVKVNYPDHPDVVKRLNVKINCLPDTVLFRQGHKPYRWGRAVSLMELKKIISDALLVKLPSRNTKRTLAPAPAFAHC
jgi:thiol-disulfide isomerase/thioredoxin